MLPLLGAALIWMPTPTPAVAADAKSLVEALKAIAGNPPKVRATFAKGQRARCIYAVG